MTWEEIRTQWVNGNREDVADRINQMSKIKIFRLMYEAVTDHYSSLDKGTHSGSIIDLLEILKRVAHR